MKERLNKLLTIKSIVTIILTAVFSYLAIIGKITPDDVVKIFLMIIGFYFGTQKEKKGTTPEV